MRVCGSHWRNGSDAQKKLVKESGQEIWDLLPDILRRYCFYHSCSYILTTSS